MFNFYANFPVVNQTLLKMYKELIVHLKLVIVQAFFKAFKLNIIFALPAHDSKKVDAKV